MVGRKELKMKKGFVICSVRGASEEYRLKLEKFVESKEREGWILHLPHRDTNQQALGIDICRENMLAIKRSNRIFIFYNSESQGTHFDMGVAFALNKPIEVIESVTYGEGKSYPRMLTEWENKN